MPRIPILLLAASLAAQDVTPAMPKPNILWICTDQQRYDSLGCTGNPWVHTPNLDRLAKEGASCDLAFSTSPVCMPSRGSFLTGRHPRAIGMVQNGDALPQREEANLVTRRLRDQGGYVNGLAGKLHLRMKPGGAEARFDEGYSDFHWSPCGNPADWPECGYQGWLRQQGLPATVTQVNASRTVQTTLPAPQSQSAWCVDRAIDFIRARQADGRPWLHSLNLFDPHHPFDPPPELLARYLDRLDQLPLPAYLEGELADKPEAQRAYHKTTGPIMGSEYAFPRMDAREHRLIRAAYWAMIDNIDLQVGRLLAALDAAGMRQNTLVIVTSDHGELLGDHGLYLKGQFYYDASVRVPLLLRWPGRIPAGIRSQALVELSDLAPTVLDAAGLPPNPQAQGRSLLPLLRGEVAETDFRAAVLCEMLQQTPTRTQGVVGPLDGSMLRTRRHKLVAFAGRDEGELYDLEADPGEHRNLWRDPAHAALRQELERQLAARQVEIAR